MKLFTKWNSKALTRSGKCEPIEISNADAALCQSTFSSYSTNILFKW